METFGSSGGSGGGGNSSSNSLKHYKKSMIHEYETKVVVNNDTDDIEQQQSKKTSSTTTTSSSSKNNVYCVCRSSDTQRFMVGCDSCDEWYHGDCVGLNESFTNNIKTYYCHLCRFKNPQLNIKYKKRTEKELREKYFKDFNKWENKEHELLKKSGLVSNDAVRSSSNNKPSNIQQQQQVKSKETKLNNDIDSKLNLIRNTISKEDVEHFVSAIFQFGHENTTSSPLLNNASLLADLSLAASISPPITKTSSINHHFNQTPSSPHATTTTKHNNDESHGMKRQFKEEKVKDSVYFPQQSDDEDDDYDDSTNYEPKIKKKRGRRKKNELESTTSSTNVGSGSNKKTSTAATKTKSNDQLLLSNETYSSHSRHRHHHRHHQNSDDGNDVDSIRQCLGPSCIEVARNGSKYCSDECGIKLAKKRLVYFLNEKIKTNEDIKEPTVADELNEKQLKKIDEDVEASKTRLNEIEKEHLKLDSIVEKAKTKKINENADNDRDIEETEIYCVTCGQSCSERHALKHMEKCFNKYESKAFFGSVFKSHQEGQTIFCDYYNAQTKMYCKRLKVICPEHEKEKKINEDEVCGCPLYKKNNVLEDSDDICLQSKRNCQIHFKWEKLRRAQLDLEKLRLLMKLDELYEQKRMIESATSNRNGILSVLLHKTIKHNS